jgi:hypothetical protein
MSIELDMQSIRAARVMASVLPHLVLDLIQIVVLHGTPGVAEQRADLHFSESGFYFAQLAGAYDAASRAAEFIFPAVRSGRREAAQ